MVGFARKRFLVGDAANIQPRRSLKFAAKVLYILPLSNRI